MTEQWIMNSNGIRRKRSWTVTSRSIVLASGWRTWRIWQIISVRVFVFAINIRENTASFGHKTEALRLVTQKTETIQIPHHDIYITVCSLFNIHDYFSPSHLALKPLELNLYPLNVPSTSSNSHSVPTPWLHSQGCSINHCKESCWNP
jgi:hypothetical protein